MNEIETEALEEQASIFEAGREHERELVLSLVPGNSLVTAVDPDGNFYLTMLKYALENG